MRLIKKEHDESELISFDSVAINALFVDMHGYLCQKWHEKTYHVIADEDGFLLCDWRSEIEPNSLVVSRILDVKKVEF